MEAFLPFYGRRKGRPLRNTSKRLLEELLPAYVVPDNTSDPAKLFTHNPRKLYLEIGFGGGEHLAMVAKKPPRKCLYRGRAIFEWRKFFSEILPG